MTSVHGLKPSTRSRRADEPIRRATAPDDSGPHREPQSQAVVEHLEGVELTARWNVHARNAARECGTRRRAWCVPFVRVIFRNAVDVIEDS